MITSAKYFIVKTKYAQSDQLIVTPVKAYLRPIYR